MAKPFAPGAHVLMRHVWRDEIFLAVPVTVVQDEPDLLVTWLAPGTSYMRPAARAALPFHQQLVDKPWRAPGILQLTRPGEAHGVWVFPDGWYVNLQEPIRRTRLGFDTRDQLLDLIRRPDGRWRWKDEHELDAAVAAGFVSAGEAAEIRAEGERVIAADRFPTGWEDWEPDPAWRVPELPPDWHCLS